MLLNHIKIAFRNIRRQPFYSWINIGGLTLSLAVAILMLMWIWDEVQVNRFQANGDRLYKVYMGFFDANGKLEPWESSSYPLGQAAKERIPEVEDVLSLGRIAEMPLEWQGRKLKGKGMDASMNIFDWMSFPLLQGAFDLTKASVAQLAISRSMAGRLFGNDWRNTAVGEAIKLGEGVAIPLVAVFEDVPTYSTLQFDFVINLANRPVSQLNQWGNHSFSNYLLLNDPAAADKVQQKITEIYLASDAADANEFVITQSLQDEYLHSRFDEKGGVAGGRIEYVRIFFFAALFLLLIACVNFVNLATARASKRAKEVGVRKVVGAAQVSLIKQFLTESGVITGLSIGLALAIVVTVLPQVRILTEKSMTIGFSSPIVWLGLGGLGLLTAFLAGAYPALLLSSFKLKNILRGKLMTNIGHIQIRRMLVVFQFVMSIVLIVGALIVQRQIQYIQSKNLGLDRANIMQVPLNNAAREKYEVIKENLNNSAGISGVTLNSENPLAINHRSNGVQWPGKTPQEETIHFDFLYTEDNFPETFGAEMAQGRFYETDQRADSNAVVINETAVRVMGLQEPLGKKINVYGEDRQIIGIMKDFHTLSLHKIIPPVVINPHQDWNDKLFIRTEAGKTTEALASLETVMASVVPDFELEYTFLDDSYARQYRTETLMGTLANWFAIFSMIISTLGMLGLATFSAENRAKEIGVRRVLGATVFQIVQLLSRDFVRLVFFAAVIALPLAYCFSQNWLTQFAYHTQAGWGIFALAFALIMTVSMLTVGLQGFKAGTVNPVERLRSE